MKLKELLHYDNIVIQCHDNPDADAIASGYGLYQYFKMMGKQTRFIYSGNARIQKKNLVMMVEELQIPIEYVTELAAPDLLILTDCQYGEGNVTRFDAKQVAMIDHHEICVKKNEFTEIRSNYGSCSTVVYSMLLDEGIRVSMYKELVTALYYGLYMDTNGFSEIKHVTANDLAQYITEGLGNGGGHRMKAGGFINANKYKEAYCGRDFGNYLEQRMTQYFGSYHVLDTTSEIVDTSGMTYYKKLPVTVGFAKTTGFAPEGTVLIVRTLEGNVTINSDPNIYIMIGVEGEIYPIDKGVFEASYQVLDEPYQINAEYRPRVRNKRTEEVYFLSDFAKPCVNIKENKILAKQLSVTTKLFTKWYCDDYMLGNAGDYLAVKLDGNNDAYIIKKDIMEKTYQRIYT